MVDLQDFANQSLSIIANRKDLSGAVDAPIINVVNIPWDKPPQGFIAFDELTAIELPVVGANAFIMQYAVPDGWEGVIKSYSCNFDGIGFAEGSGDIVWRLYINDQPYKGFANIITQRGSTTAQRFFGDGGIRIFSQDVVKWYVEHVSNAGVNGNTIAGITGWIYPVNQVGG